MFSNIDKRTFRQRTQIDYEESDSESDSSNITVTPTNMTSNEDSKSTASPEPSKSDSIMSHVTVKPADPDLTAKTAVATEGGDTEMTDADEDSEESDDSDKDEEKPYMNPDQSWKYPL